MDTQLTITIGLDNAAFGTTFADRAEEVCRILNDLAHKYSEDPEKYLDGEQFSVKDLNGNTVGDSKVERL